MKQLGIIIVTYQSEQYIGPLLQSLVATVDAEECVVIIWDNHSQDGTEAAIRREAPNLTFEMFVLLSPDNVGFMRANNQAYATLQEESPCETVVLLNPDTVVREGWWQPLFHGLKEPGTGTLASLLLLPDGTVNACGNALHFLGLGFVQDYGAAEDQLPKKPTLFFGSGAALAFRPAMLEIMNSRLGLTGIFWEELFLYADDTDLGWRMKLVGLENRLAIGSRVVHDHRFWQKPLGEFGDRLFYIERNRYLLMLANFKRRTLIVLFPWVVASEIALALRVWKMYPHRLKLWRAILAETRTPAFRERRRKIREGRSVGDGPILAAMTGSIRHGALPFGLVDRVLDFFLRASHRLICGLVSW